MGPDGSLLDDFAFCETARIVNVINAPSPAATAIHPALARQMKTSERNPQTPMPTPRAGFQPFRAIAPTAI